MMWRRERIIGGSMVTTSNPWRTIGSGKGCTSREKMSFKSCWIGCQHVSFFIVVCEIVVSIGLRLIIVFGESYGRKDNLHLYFFPFLVVIMLHMKFSHLGTSP
jgi:hypothetical protein